MDYTLENMRKSIRFWFWHRAVLECTWYLCQYSLYTTIRKQFHLKSSLIYKNNSKTNSFNSVKGYRLAKVFLNISHAHGILQGKVIFHIVMYYVRFKEQNALHILYSRFKCTIAIACFWRKSLKLQWSSNGTWRLKSLVKFLAQILCVIEQQLTRRKLVPKDLLKPSHLLHKFVCAKAVHKPEGSCN